MSLNFTVQKVEEFQGLPDGEYKAQVDHIEQKHSEFGTFHIVHWKIISPDAYEGRVHQERYNLQHENDQVRNIAINNFSKFCIEIGGLREGDEPTEDDFLLKIANIWIRNRIGKKDGRSYANVVKMEILDGNKAARKDDLSTGGLILPSVLPTAPASSALPLNDEVPF